MAISWCPVIKGNDDDAGFALRHPVTLSIFQIVAEQKTAFARTSKKEHGVSSGPSRILRPIVLMSFVVEPYLSWRVLCKMYDSNLGF
eukprot:scaffold10690_cov126-Cylindrotheca_fusiformis.AAC.7